MSVGFLALGFVTTCLSWILISRYGRRRIYNIGLAFLTLIMFIIAFLDFAPDYKNRPGIVWAQSTLLVRCIVSDLPYKVLLHRLILHVLM